MNRAMSPAVDEADAAGAIWLMYSNGRASYSAPPQRKPCETSCARAWGIGAGSMGSAG